MSEQEQRKPSWTRRVLWICLVAFVSFLACAAVYFEGKRKAVERLEEQGFRVETKLPDIPWLDRFGWFWRLKRKYLSSVIVLSCERRSLAGLDLSPFPDLQELYCPENNLTHLDLSHCPKLRDLRCFDNQLTSLDLSLCPNLEVLYCQNNRLTNLDLSSCPDLIVVDCHNNNLTGTLDLSSNTQLNDLYLYAEGNSLSEIIIADTNNPPFNFDYDKGVVISSP